jgi:hypothetical protein
MPALTRFANSSPAPFVNTIKAARTQIVARTDKDRADFLRKRNFSRSDTAKIIETVLAEEGHPPTSLFDVVQGISALAKFIAPMLARFMATDRAFAKTRREKHETG